MPNQPKTPHRTIRVADDPWYSAMRAAESEGLLLSDVIRAALSLYAASPAFRRHIQREVQGEVRLL